MSEENPRSNMTQTLSIAAVAVVLFLASHKTQAESAYKCIVQDQRELQDNGTLHELSSLNPLNAIGEEFIVDKETGRTSGALINHSAYGSPEVMDIGSDQQAYKAITIYQPFTMVELLYVEEYKVGRKPFFFTSGTSVYSGICTDY
jgi:hypothetical protein